MPVDEITELRIKLVEDRLHTLEVDLSKKIDDVEKDQQRALGGIDSKLEGIVHQQQDLLIGVAVGKKVEENEDMRRKEIAERLVDVEKAIKNLQIAIVVLAGLAGGGQMALKFLGH